MANLSEAISIQIMKDLWKKDVSYELVDDLAWKYFKTAIFHVENLDYPKDNEWTFNETTNVVTFTTTPADSSYMLYIYRGLSDLYGASLNGSIVDNAVGVSWRSGMETVSTATAGRLQASIGEKFAKRYDDALTSVKINGQTIWRYDIYDDSI